MISKKMNDAINEQINKEIYSGYLYLAMASYAEAEGLVGTAAWFKVQCQEEMTHAQRFYMYVNQQGGRVVFAGIDEPPCDFKNMTDLFKQTLDHEKEVTRRINALVDLARSENDHASEAMLQWFVTEQVEEEASPTEILQKLKIIGNDGNGVLTIDNELGTRVFTPPADLQNA